MLNSREFPMLGKEGVVFKAFKEPSAPSSGQH